MPASFPSSPKSFTTKVDFTDTVLAQHVNDLQLEVTAIESHLVGTGGSMRTSSGWVGTFDQSTTEWSSVRARLNNMEYGIGIATTDATTSVKGIVRLTDSTSSTSVTTAATPKSVKSAYDLANSAYTLAVSGSGSVSKADIFLLMGA